MIAELGYGRLLQILLDLTPRNQVQVMVCRFTLHNTPLQSIYNCNAIATVQDPIKAKIWEQMQIHYIDLSSISKTSHGAIETYYFQILHFCNK